MLRGFGGAASCGAVITTVATSVATPAGACSCLGIDGRVKLRGLGSACASAGADVSVGACACMRRAGRDMFRGLLGRMGSVFKVAICRGVRSGRVILRGLGCWDG